MRIYYESHLDGDGRLVYPGFLGVIKEKIGRVNSIHEAFAGAAFIGFSLLADEMCEKLILSDIEKECIECCKKTVMENNLEDKTSLYQSNCLEQIPNQEWDLVVGNPPHFSEHQGNLPQTDLITVDTNWDIHRKFYRNIGKYLKPMGSTILVENGRGSSPEVFDDMIKEGGLRTADILKCEVGRPSKFYFIWAKKISKLNNF